MKLLDALRPRGASPEVTRYTPPSWMTDGTYLPQASPFQPAYTTTWGKTPAEPIGDNFCDYVTGGLAGNGVIWSIERVRVALFAEARFQYQKFAKGRPSALWGNEDLEILEHPWTGGTTGDLMARMLLDADFAGNYFAAELHGEIVRLRPDWVEIVLAKRLDNDGAQVGWEKLGYLYYEGGKQDGVRPAAFLPEDVVHFAPYPDPLANWRGMSWITPVVREVMSDGQATKHKLKWFENAATPNLAVSLPKEISPADFTAFVNQMEDKHTGVDNAHKTLYVGGGADVSIVGANMQQMDFKITQGAGESRLAAAGGIHPTIVGLSEGLQGSSLNSGNFGAARRLVADATLRPLWRNAAGSLEVLVKPPKGSRLWYDARDVAFLREDAMDAAKIVQIQASVIGNLVREGFEPESAIAAVTTENMDLLVHSGLLSVQLQPPGMPAPTPSSVAPPADGHPPAGLQTPVNKPGGQPVRVTKSGKPDGRAGRDANSNGSVVGAGGHEG